MSNQALREALRMAGSGTLGGGNGLEVRPGVEVRLGLVGLAVVTSMGGPAVEVICLQEQRSLKDSKWGCAVLGARAVLEWLQWGGGQGRRAWALAVAAHPIGWFAEGAGTFPCMPVHAPVLKTPE